MATSKNKSQKSTIEIQRALRGLGIYTGKIDGVWGPKTSRAVRAFQRIHNLSDDGIVGKATIAELFPSIIHDRQNLILQAKPKPVVVPPSKAGGLITPRYSECMNWYGDVGTQQIKVDLPSGYDMWLAWDLRKKVKFISLHKKVADSAYACLQQIKDEFTASEREQLGLDLFGGSLNVRKMRGGNNWSTHSWGVAIDFDPARNQLRWNSSKARLGQADASRFWGIWEKAGWTSLGRAKNYDWMHVQAVQL